MVTSIYSANISRQALIAGQRSFVNFEDAKVTYVDTGDVGPGRTIGVWFNVINNGNTSTKDFLSYKMCRKVDINNLPNEPFDLFQWNEKDANRDILGPKQKTSIGNCDLKPEDGKQLSDGKLAIYLLAEVRYRDIVDPAVRHVTQSSQRLYMSRFDPTILRTPQWSADAVGRHNCADDDCAK